MNFYDEALRDPFSHQVEALFRKKQLENHDVTFLTRTEAQYVRIAFTFESGLSALGELMSTCECETLDNAQVKDLGHFIAALVPASQLLRSNAALARDVLVKHGLYEA